MCARRHTGKTQLWRRLQGLSFGHDLPTTRVLGTVHLDWSSERSADVVKVEAWDVVDADLTRATRSPAGLAFSHHSSPGEKSPRTVATLDVWRGAHAAVCLFDPRKRWTFAYAQRLLLEAPAHIPVLLLANFADLLDADAPASGGVASGAGTPAASGAAGSGGEVVPWTEVEQAAEEETARSGRRVVCVRGSAADCRGLAAVHAFIQLPYYQMVRSSLERSQLDADASLARAEAHLRAMAAGEPFQEDLHDFYPAVTASSTPAAVAPAAALSPDAAKRVAPLPHTPSDAPTPSSRPSATAPTPKLAPPPTPTPPPTTTPSHAPSLAIEAIDDSFFDGLDAMPPAAGPSSATAASGTPPAPHRGPAAQLGHEHESGEDDGEDETEDLLPLLDDPDDE